MTHFVCRCGCNRFAIEQLPRGTGWCRLLLTCRECGEIAQVFAEDVAGVLRVRTTGPIALVTGPGPAPTATTNDCPCSYEFREVL